MYTNYFFQAYCMKAAEGARCWQLGFVDITDCLVGLVGWLVAWLVGSTADAAYSALGRFWWQIIRNSMEMGISSSANEVWWLLTMTCCWHGVWWWICWQQDSWMSPITLLMISKLGGSRALMCQYFLLACDTSVRLESGTSISLDYLSIEESRMQEIEESNMDTCKCAMFWKLTSQWLVHYFENVDLNDFQTFECYNSHHIIWP